MEYNQDTREVTIVLPHQKTWKGAKFGPSGRISFKVTSTRK